MTTRMSFRAVHIFLIKSILAPSSLMEERFAQFNSQKFRDLQETLHQSLYSSFSFHINYNCNCEVVVVRANSCSPFFLRFTRSVPSQKSWSSCMDCALWFLFEYAWSCCPSNPSKSDVQTLLYSFQGVLMKSTSTAYFVSPPVNASICDSPYASLFLTQQNANKYYELSS